MAVAAHVSRVDKSYAPHGYSVMEDVVVRFGAISTDAEGAQTILAIYVATDADSYVEGASVVFDEENASDADWDVEIVNETAEEVMNSSAVNTADVEAFVNTDLGIDQSQIVASGSVLSVVFTEGALAGTAMEAGAVVLRVRRKA